ncbi:ribosome biogenesis factor YjgA [Alteromonas sp. CYL-A6]|uniref:ribosome biogenesis factor YjgA n=1 Tax=Alteromonas nitratireducens TaxID=3390813 RepID=UPI0034BF345A
MSDHKSYSGSASPFDDIEDNGDEWISKSELKRQADARQKLGETLVDLTPSHLATIPMDDDLEEAVMLARSINRKKDGFRRQLQFIGKLLRGRDTADIEAALDRLNHQHQASNAAFHAIEKARDAIISQGDAAIQSLLEAHPGLERQKLRQFHRQINKEREKNAPPKAFRELFQYLKEHMPTA